MDIRILSPDFAVSPQIHASDMAQLKEEGFTHIICNRPAHESAAQDMPEEIAAAAEAAGLTFSDNPVTMGQLSMDNIEGQRAEGKVLAYCASGTRSAIVWALSQAGQQKTDAILAALERAGFPMPQIGQQIDALAQK